MLISLKQLSGDKLGTSNGEVGHVKDFYFNDAKWVVRYVVINMGPWGVEQLVLISPHAFVNFDQVGGGLLVNLSREQIQNSPSIDLHKPVSRQYEEEFYRYYGWPAYWDGAEMWGFTGFPAAPPPQEFQNGKHEPLKSSDDPHLRSVKAVTGYRIETKAGDIGHVTDFLMDTKSWEVRHLVVETGHWYSGKEIVIEPKHIDRISYDDSSVLVNISKESILEAPEYHSHPLVPEVSKRSVPTIPNEKTKV